MQIVKVQVLAFEGCPNVEEALLNVRRAAEQEGVEASISQIEVDTPELAASSKFLGSPTVRVNGVDIEPGANLRTEYGLMCRTYRNGSQSSGAPPIAMIREAIRRDRSESRDILSSWTATAAFYWLPITAMVVSGINISQGWRAAVWTVALTIMGSACLANARRCGRVHCFVTGPFFLIMAIVTALYGLGIAALGTNGWTMISLTTLVGGVILYCLPEVLLGRYQRREHQSSSQQSSPSKASRPSLIKK